MFSLICTWVKGWVNNHEAGDLRRHCAHHDVNVTTESCLFLSDIVCDDNTIHSFLWYGNRTLFSSSIWSNLILSTLWSSLTPLGPSWHLLFSVSHFVSQLIRHFDSNHMAYFFVSINNLRTFHFCSKQWLLILSLHKFKRHFYIKK